MSMTNIANLTKIESDLNQLKEYIVQRSGEAMVYSYAGEIVPVPATAQQSTNAMARCNDLLTTIKADVLALETL